MPRPRLTKIQAMRPAGTAARPARPTRPEGRAERVQIVAGRYAGMWVAWDEQNRQIVGAGGSPQEARAEAERKGHRGTFSEYIPTPAEARLG